MPEHVQINTDTKADEPELELGRVVSFNGRFAFVRPDRGGTDVYLGQPELARAGIERLQIGARVAFEIRRDRHRRKPWGANIRLAETPA
jgi:cold shock CspA family protein